EDISGRVRGEEGTKVSIGFERDGEIITLEITRAPINNTVYGEIMADGTGYLEIIQFGDTTAQEARGYLEDFRDRNVQELIIDLRGDGGGYLDSLRAVASLFIEDGPVIMKQVYSDGKVEELRSVEGLAFDFAPVVLLVDRNTASAAEVFTLAMKENRDDVTIIGETTYGKGTVQITRYFNDGSALKYTTSKWVSSQDVWVNGTGIEPDIAVANHEVIGTTYAEMPDEGSFSYDSVSEFVRFAQLGLDYLEYAPDRTDGYLSHGTENALRQFQQDAGLEATGILDQKTYNTLISRIILDYNTNRDHDPQLQKALEVLHG
ncbi:MAG: peptidoglycan-binding protein, partial [Solobacterium sp.]|nr:peptidoglycan-binding protein [Solobacterium sp.]